MDLKFRFVLSLNFLIKSFTLSEDFITLKIEKGSENFTFHDIKKKLASIAIPTLFVQRTTIWFGILNLYHNVII